MNILPVNLQKPFYLNPTQKQQCGANEECLAYIAAQDIHVTTCGTHIHADNVFPQKSFARIIDRRTGMLEFHGKINEHPVIAVANTELINRQKMLEFCAKKSVYPTYDEYSECKHVKFLVDSKNITIAK